MSEAIIVLVIISAIGISLFLLIPIIEERNQRYTDKIESYNCKELAIHIREGGSTSFYTGESGNLFESKCYPDDYAAENSTSTYAKMYISELECDDLKQWIIDKYPEKNYAENDYHWRCEA